MSFKEIGERVDLFPLRRCIPRRVTELLEGFMIEQGVKSALGSLAIKIDRMTYIKAKPILRFERKDTLRKGAKGAKFGE